MNDRVVQGGKRCFESRSKGSRVGLISTAVALGGFARQVGIGVLGISKDILESKEIREGRERVVAHCEKERQEEDGEKGSFSGG